MPLIHSGLMNATNQTRSAVSGARVLHRVRAGPEDSLGCLVPQLNLMQTSGPHDLSNGQPAQWRRIQAGRRRFRRAALDYPIEGNGRPARAKFRHCGLKRGCWHYRQGSALSQQARLGYRHERWPTPAGR